MVGMVLFQPIHYNNIIGLPNKLFEYMACGKPVIASDFPEIRTIVEETDCGILVDPSNINDIEKAIIWMLKNPEEAQEMGLRGRKAIEYKYNWAEMEKLLFNMYKEIS
jgi:glycosyltransferase involved in cell wall biosynthesis